jgi:glycerophosphoryl diester phosphodiesterase
VVVISHDPFLTPERCLDPKGKPLKKPVAIRKTKLKDVLKYDCGSLKNPKFAEQTPVPKTHIPTLEEFLIWKTKEAPQMEMNIETKMDDTKDIMPNPEHFVQKVVELLRKYNGVDKAILQSFDFRTLEAAKKIEPKLRLSCLFEENANPKEICALTQKTGATIVSPYYKLLNKENVAECHEKKIQVVPWTINESSDWDTLVALGVDAIITDSPRKLVQYLKGR